MKIIPFLCPLPSIGPVNVYLIKEIRTLIDTGPRHRKQSRRSAQV